jgi:hypothetical protein
MQLPLDECMQTTSRNRAAAIAQLWPVRPVCSALVRPVPNIWIGPALWPIRPVTNRAQKWLEST